MNQHQVQQSAKKRNITSPSKTQTSITSFSSSASTQNKKSNNNPTPPRTAVDRAMTSIMPSEHPKMPPRLLTLEKSPVNETAGDSRLANNPYKTLADGDDEEEILNLFEDKEQTSRDKVKETLNTPGNVHDEEEPIINDQEKIILSNKAQQALRKLRTAKRALLDSAIRAELEEVYGKVELLSPLKPLEEPQDKEDVIRTSTEDEKDSGEGSNIPSSNTQVATSSNQSSSTNPNAQEQTPQENTQKTPAASPTSRNVSFAIAVSGPPNSNNLAGVTPLPTQQISPITHTLRRQMKVSYMLIDLLTQLKWINLSL
jgi:hypothetical protein